MIVLIILGVSVLTFLLCVWNNIYLVLAILSDNLSTRRQVLVQVYVVTLRPSAGPIHTVTDPLTGKPDDDRSSPGSSIAVVRLTTQAVAPLEVGGPGHHTHGGWLFACIAQYYRLQTRG